MPLYEFAPDTGHESDYRAVGANGLYLKPRPQPPTNLAALADDLEARAKEFHQPGTYGYNFLMGTAARHRATLARK